MSDTIAPISCRPSRQCISLVWIALAAVSLALIGGPGASAENAPFGMNSVAATSTPFSTGDSARFAVTGSSTATATLAPESSPITTRVPIPVDGEVTELPTDEDTGTGPTDDTCASVVAPADDSDIIAAGEVIVTLRGGTFETSAKVDTFASRAKVDTFPSQGIGMYSWSIPSQCFETVPQGQFDMGEVTAKAGACITATTLSTEYGTRHDIGRILLDLDKAAEVDRQALAKKLCSEKKDPCAGAKPETDMNTIRLRLGNAFIAAGRRSPYSFTFRPEVPNGGHWYISGPGIEGSVRLGGGAPLLSGLPHSDEMLADQLAGLANEFVDYWQLRYSRLQAANALISAYERDNPHSTHAFRYDATTGYSQVRWRAPDGEWKYITESGGAELNIGPVEKELARKLAAIRTMDALELAQLICALTNSPSNRACKDATPRADDLAALGKIAAFKKYRKFNGAGPGGAVTGKFEYALIDGRFHVALRDPQNPGRSAGPWEQIQQGDQWKPFGIPVSAADRLLMNELLLLQGKSPEELARKRCEHRVRDCSKATLPPGGVNQAMQDAVTVLLLANQREVVGLNQMDVYGYVENSFVVGPYQYQFVIRNGIGYWQVRARPMPTTSSSAEGWIGAISNLSRQYGEIFQPKIWHTITPATLAQILPQIISSKDSELIKSIAELANMSKSPALLAQTLCILNESWQQTQLVRNEFHNSYHEIAAQMHSILHICGASHRYTCEALDECSRSSWIAPIIMFLQSASDAEREEFRRLVEATGEVTSTLSLMLDVYTSDANWDTKLIALSQFYQKVAELRRRAGEPNAAVDAWLRESQQMLDRLKAVNRALRAAAGRIPGGDTVYGAAQTGTLALQGNAEAEQAVRDALRRLQEDPLSLAGEVALRNLLAQVPPGPLRDLVETLLREPDLVNRIYETLENPDCKDSFEKRLMDALISWLLQRAGVPQFIRENPELLSIIANELFNNGGSLILNSSDPAQLAAQVKEILIRVFVDWILRKPAFATIAQGDPGFRNEVIAAITALLSGGDPGGPIDPARMQTALVEMLKNLLAGRLASIIGGANSGINQDELRGIIRELLEESIQGNSFDFTDTNRLQALIERLVMSALAKLVERGLNMDAEIVKMVIDGIKNGSLSGITFGGIDEDELDELMNEIRNGITALQSGRTDQLINSATVVARLVYLIQHVTRYRSSTGLDVIRRPAAPRPPPAPPAPSAEESPRGRLRFAFASEFAPYGAGDGTNGPGPENCKWTKSVIQNGKTAQQVVPPGNPSATETATLPPPVNVEVSIAYYDDIDALRARYLANQIALFQAQIAAQGNNLPESQRKKWTPTSCINLKRDAGNVFAWFEPAIAKDVKKTTLHVPKGANPEEQEMTLWFIAQELMSIAKIRGQGNPIVLWKIAFDFLCKHNLTAALYQEEVTDGGKPIYSWQLQKAPPCASDDMIKNWAIKFVGPTIKTNAEVEEALKKLTDLQARKQKRKEKIRFDPSAANPSTRPPNGKPVDGPPGGGGGAQKPIACKGSRPNYGPANRCDWGGFSGTYHPPGILNLGPASGALTYTGKLDQNQCESSNRFSICRMVCAKDKNGKFHMVAANLEIQLSATWPPTTSAPAWEWTFKLEGFEAPQGAAEPMDLYPDVTDQAKCDGAGTTAAQAWGGLQGTAVNGAATPPYTLGLQTNGQKCPDVKLSNLVVIPPGQNPPAGVVQTIPVKDCNDKFTPDKCSCQKLLRRHPSLPAGTSWLCVCLPKTLEPQVIQHVKADINDAVTSHPRLDGGGHTRAKTETDLFNKWLNNSTDDIVTDFATPPSPLPSGKKVRDAVVDYFCEGKTLSVDERASITTLTRLAELCDGERLQRYGPDKKMLRITYPWWLMTEKGWGATAGTATSFGGVGATHGTHPLHLYQAGGKTVYWDGYDYEAAAKECLTKAEQQCSKTIVWPKKTDKDPPPPAPNTDADAIQIVPVGPEMGMIICKTADGVRHIISLGPSPGGAGVRVSSMFPAWNQ